MSLNPMRRLCTLTCLVTAFGVSTAGAATTFDSYTDAYRRAGKTHKPMLVVLNGPQAAVDVDELAADDALASAIGDYVVAEIDTRTRHGQKVHELFKSPSLPHVVVIDDDQQKQLFKTSRSMTADELTSVLTDYKDGPPAAEVSTSDAVTVMAGKPVVDSPIFSPASSPVVGSPVVGSPIVSSPIAAAPVVSQPVYSAPISSPTPISSAAPISSAPAVSVPSFSPGLPQAVPANCPSCKLKAMGLIP